MNKVEEITEALFQKLARFDFPVTYSTSEVLIYCQTATYEDARKWVFFPQLSAREESRRRHILSTLVQLERLLQNNEEYITSLLSPSVFVRDLAQNRDCLTSDIKELPSMYSY